MWGKGATIMFFDSLYRWIETNLMRFQRNFREKRDLKKYQILLIYIDKFDPILVLFLNCKSASGEKTMSVELYTVEPLSMRFCYVMCTLRVLGFYSNVLEGMTRGF